MTVGELASLRSMREVIVAEISPGVIEAAPLFDYGNQHASTNPTVQIVISDAYRALLRSQGRFDAIVSIRATPGWRASRCSSASSSWKRCTLA